MIRQPTADEYDLAFLEAKRDLATNGSISYTSNVEENEFITKESFLEDLRKVAMQQLRNYELEDS